jgi:hypothetical protein
MTVRRSTSLAVVLTCGALVAGCGGSGSSTTSDASTTTSAPVKTSTSTASTPTSSTPGGSPKATAGSPASAAVASQYVAVCKAIIDREPTLAANVKSKVEGICAKAADGNLAAARKAAKEVCVEIINASPIPASVKSKALASCRAS